MNTQSTTNDYSTGKRNAGWQSLPDFCQSWLLLNAIVWSQFGALLMQLGRGLPVNWSNLGLLSCYAIWVSLLVILSWCCLRRFMLIPNVQRVAGWRHSIKLIWMLLWFLSIAIAALAALLVATIGSGVALPLLPAQLPPGQFILHTSICSAVLAGVLLRYLWLQQRWQLQQHQLARSELRNLQTRLRPHFLYNTLNTIAALVEEQPEAAIDAIEDLGDLLRQSLQPRSRLVSIAQELELCRKYINLLQWRMGDRLRQQWQIDQALEQSTTRWKLPPLSVQLLVENAILHGIQPNPDGGMLTVTAAIEQQVAVITVTNPLAELPDHPAATTGTGTALTDLQRRLWLLFDGKAELICKQEQGLFIASLRLPRMVAG